jgi:phosphate:Na+ symporter
VIKWELLDVEYRGEIMSVYEIIVLLAGLALFLYGMSVMGKALEKAAGGTLEKILQKCTKNIFTAILLGLSVTALIQSSSATTVLVVGFVNAGFLTLKQSIRNLIWGKYWYDNHSANN